LFFSPYEIRFAPGEKFYGQRVRLERETASCPRAYRVAEAVPEYDNTCKTQSFGP
jgi:hypothetical protein